MTDTAKLLIESRQAHKTGRAALSKSPETAREAFKTALKKRLAARASDPQRLDPEWVNDLRNVHKGVLWSGRITPERVAQMDYDLEFYFREHMGKSRNVVSQVDLNTPGAVVLPDEWQATQKATRGACGTCSHDKSNHPLGECTVSTFNSDGIGITACPCLAFVPTCQHAWESTSPKTRRCLGCGEQQALTVKMQREDSEAFKQLQREAQKKS